jgi:signal transduction histidine kinase
VLRPLTSATTYRRGVFLLLGGVVLLPYGLVAAMLARAYADGGDNRAGVLATAFVALLIGAVPPFLAGTRELEITAARALLGVELPDHDRSRPPAAETRLRSALWFGLHLLFGALICTAVLIAVPLALLAFAERLGLTRGALTGLPHGSGRWWWTVAGAGLLVGTLYATAALGALAASMAPVLLGPAPAERIAALEARERRLAERNRLARELHDSVGHALTAATLQAAAARAVFDRDPEFARRALGTIEDLGRTALDELDTVLGVLRESGSEAETGTQPTLADLDRLITGEVDAEVTLGDLPAVVSREAYRIVQESLTNAAKHGAGRARLRITVPDDLVVEVVNPLAATAGPASGGRGIEGMRERVRLLGGELTAGPREGVWRVVARLPMAEGTAADG